MRRFIIRLVVALLALFLGVSASGVWEYRRAIIDACTEFARDYQD